MDKEKSGWFVSLVCEMVAGAHFFLRACDLEGESTREPENVMNKENDNTTRKTAFRWMNFFIFVFSIGLFLVFSVNVAEAVTIIKQTSFEQTQGNDPIGYTLQDTNVVGSIGRTTNNPRTGSYSMEFNDVENSGTVAFNPVDVSGFTKASVEIWFEPDNTAWAAGGNIRVWAIVDTNTQLPGIPNGPSHPVGGFQGTDDGNALDDAGDVYRQFGFTLPDTATQVELFVQLVGGNGNQAWIDDMTVFGYNDTQTIAKTSFEQTQASDPIGYTLQDANVVGSIGRTTNNPRTGSYSMEFNDVENSGTVAFDPVDVSGADSIGVELWFEPDNTAWAAGDNIRVWILADTNTQIPGIPNGPSHPVGGFAGTDDGNALDDAGDIYRLFSFVAPDTATQVELFVQLVGGNGNQAWIDDVVFINLTEPTGVASVNITSPATNHDTNVTPITMTGTVSNADVGDSVVIINSLGSMDTVAVQSDSSWTATSVDLATGADSVVANLKDTDATSATVAQDTITVTLDQTAPDSTVTGVALNDTGHFAFEATWDTFANDPDTGSGFGQWVVFYKKGTGVTTSDSRWDSDSDADLTSFLNGDSTVVGSGLAADVQFSFRVTYKDGATNLGPLSSEVTFTTRKQTLVLNELNIDPSTESAGEWFEIFNASADTVLLEGVQIKFNGLVWTIPTQFNPWQISPGKSVTVANDAVEFNTVWGFEPNFASSGSSGDTDVGNALSSLGNSADTVALFDASGNLLDSLCWGAPAGAQNNFALSPDGDGAQSAIRKTEGDEGRTTADRPEVGEFTERLDQTFGLSGGGFDSEGPDTDGLSVLIISQIDITSISDGHDTNVSSIDISGTTVNAGAGDSVGVSIDGGDTKYTTVQNNSDSSWNVSGIQLTGIGHRIRAVIYENSSSSSIQDTEAITVNYNDTNLIFPYNWDMEEARSGGIDSAPVDWDRQVVDNDLAWDNAEAYGGNASLALDNLEGSFEGVASETVSVSADRTYQVRAYFKVTTNVTDKDIQLGIRWLDSGGGLLGDSTSIVHVSSAGVWEQLSYSARAPASAARARFTVAGREVTNDNASINVDNAEMVDVTTPEIHIKNVKNGYDTNVSPVTVKGTTTFADVGDSVEVGVDGGDTLSTTVQADSSWSVSGIPLSGMGQEIKAVLYESSTSSSVSDFDTVIVNYNDTNLIFPYNWDMEEARSGGIDSAPMDWDRLVADNDLAWDNAEAYGGNASLALDNLETSFEGVASETVSVSADRTYQVRAYFKVTTNVTDKDIQLGIRWLDSGGGLLGDSTSIVHVSSAGVWEQLSYSARAPANAARARFTVAGREVANDNASINVDNAEMIDRGIQKTISITSPADGYDTDGSSVTVKGTSEFTTEGESVVITLNGTEVDTVAIQSDSSWTGTVGTLQFGSNTIVVNLKESGPTSTLVAQDTITVDKITLPTLMLTEVSPYGDGSADTVSPNDWLEILVVDSGTIISGWQIVDNAGGTVGLDVIDTTVLSGDTIVIHIESGTSDTITKDGGSGPDAGADQWDIYGSGIDWAADNDGAAMIREGAVVHDFVGWGEAQTSGGEAVDPAITDDLDTAIAAGQWGTVETGVKRQYDLVRIWKTTTIGQRVIYRDPSVNSDTKAGWDAVANPTLGATNDLTDFHLGVGSGTASVKPRALVVGDAGQTLRFCYTPKSDFTLDSGPFGQVTVRIPAGWTTPSLNDPTAPGYITAEATDAGADEPDTFVYVDGAGGTVVVFTFNNNLNATENDTVCITYGDKSGGGPGVTVPSTTGSYTFYFGDDPTGNNVERIASADQPEAVVVATPDTIDLTPEADPNGNPGDTTTVTATVKDASGNLLAGASVSFVITRDPGGGNSPTISDTTPSDGETDENGQVTITFTTDPNAAGVNAVRGDAAGVTGSDTFTQTTSFAGSGKAAISPSSVQINATDTFTVTYTAGLATSGGTIALVIPTGRGWTAPTTGGGAGDVSASSGDATLGTVSVNGDTVLVPFTSLPDNGIIRITYAQATAPSTIGDDIFVVKSAATGEPLQEIASSPVVAVRQFAVVINEVLPGATSDWNGDGTVDNGDDFIEIFNFGSSSVDLSGWVVDDEDNTNDPDSFPASGVTVPARGYAVAWDIGIFVVFDSNGDSINSGSLLSSGFGLDGTTADTVQLFDSSGVVVQQISYNNESAGFQNVNSDRSIERQIDNWSIFIRDSNSNFNGLPTPGIAYDITGDTPGPANGSIKYSLPATAVSTKDFTATIWVENPNGDTVSDFNTSIDLSASPGISSRTTISLSNGIFTGSINIDVSDSTVSTLSGTYAVTTRGTDALTVYLPVIDTQTVQVADGSDTLQRTNLDNSFSLDDHKNHNFSVRILHVDTASIFYRRDGNAPSTADTELTLTNTAGDTWEGTLATAAFAPGDSVSFLIFGTVIGGETVAADSAGAGYKYRVDPKIDSGSITVTDGSSTLSLSDLDGSGSLQDGTNHTVEVRIEGADTTWINDTSTAPGNVATQSDTQIYGSQTGADTWQFIIPDSDFNTADTLNFIISVQIFTDGVAVDTTIEDSGGFGFAYEVAAAANTPPSVDLVDPDTGIYVGGDISGTFVITDAEDNFCTVTLQYSDDSGVSWNTASLAGNNPREFSASAGGDTHNFTWNSDLDISNREDTDVKFRIYAFDGAETSSYDTSGLFTVDNKSPPRIVDLGSTTAISGPDTGVFLSWTFNDTDLQFFNIYRTFRTADTAMATILDTAAFTGGSHFYQDASVTRGDSFYYYITAQDTAGNESDSSNVTTGPFVSISKIYNDTAYFRPGDTIVYTIRYTNEGFGPTGEIILEDAVPDSVTLSDTPEVLEGPAAAIEYKVGGSYQSGFDSSATAVRWTVSDPQDPLASGYTGRVRFRVNIQ